MNEESMAREESINQILRKCAKLFPSSDSESKENSGPDNKVSKKTQRQSQGLIKPRWENKPSQRLYQTRMKGTSVEIRTDGKTQVITHSARKIGRYRIIAQIGEGGMGKVFKALDVTLGRIVAIKVLSERATTEEKAVLRFIREARSNARLRHSNIVPFI